ncbi:MAG: aldehyde ferredoxin oxidoreductase family protein [Chloroflexi bacterium]|nr:aldehyde ferredoxin oxidoreductase family protein [Chloroflexota bacterium]
MLGGYVGTILWVNLDTGNLREEQLDPDVGRDFIGGYGVGARLVYERIKPRIDPLGPENILGFLTGPLTGSPAPTGTRWTVVCKSPLTGGWGDANASGYFGVALKRAGYDAVFFSGSAANPVYLYLDNRRAELRDAQHLWGKDCYEIEDWVKAELGHAVQAACIGPAGEKQSLISAIIHSQGRAAARSGVGAVMGAKRIKLIAARGTLNIPLADAAAVQQAKNKYVQEINRGVGAADFYKQTGTPGYLAYGIKHGDTPTRNWAISGSQFGETKSLEFVELLKHRVKRKSCWQCPIGCWGTSRVEYAGETIEAHQPEYETGSAFGSMTLNGDYPAIIKANELCNRYGLDTISAGACIAFAMECFEHGLITARDTGGIELTWGDHRAMNAMLEKLARREDFGDVLAGGVQRAAEQLGNGAEAFAIHVGGQELPMHDPRFEPGLGLIYKMDATPGRHTQACQFTVPSGFTSVRPGYGEKRDQQAGRGRWMKEASCLNHTMNASGLCLFGYTSTHVTFVPEFLSAVTGMPFTVDDMLITGERIANVRQAFNVREGINAVTQPIPARAYGVPPLPNGPTAGITVQVEQMLHEHLDEMGWTRDAAIPTRAVLERLGLADIARELWC